MSPHTELKYATRAAHERVDQAFAGYDLADAADYGRFLERHAAAFILTEQALTNAGASLLIDGWEDLLRAPALRSDLSSLGLEAPEPLEPPPYDGEPAIFGGAYVLEGSRLGGAVLRRAVGTELPRQFLDSIQPKGRWRTFIAHLNSRLYDSERIGIATKSALETFALFESAGAGRD